MKRMLMLEQWDQFARAVLPTDASGTQRREMRRAFYGGAQAILFRVIAQLVPESGPTEADVQAMADLQQELNDFSEMVKRGRA